MVTYRFSYAVVLIGLLLSACSTDDPLPTEEQTPLTPDFRLPDTEGATFQLSETQGKVVLLQFFKHDCSACNQEAPVLKELHQEYAGQGLEIVGISVLTDLDQAKAFVDRHLLPFRVLLGEEDPRVMDAYGVTSVPTGFLLDREGIIQWRLNGAQERESLEGRIEELL